MSIIFPLLFVYSFPAYVYIKIPERKHQLADAPFHWMVRRGAADKLQSALIKSDGDLMGRHYLLLFRTKKKPHAVMDIRLCSNLLFSIPYLYALSIYQVCAIMYVFSEIDRKLTRTASSIQHLHITIPLPKGLSPALMLLTYRTI